METYTKLFSSIIASSVWQEPPETKLVWITLIAMKDVNGEVMASLPGLAHLAGVPLEAAQKAIDTFLAPDPYSRTPDHEGRRIEAISGGWKILNHDLYRGMRNDVERKAYKAEKQREYRKKASRGQCVDKLSTRGQTWTPVDHGGPSWTHTDTDTDTNTVQEDVGSEVSTECTAGAVPTSQKAKKVVLCDDDYLTQLQGMSCYSGIDVQQEYGKAQAWCLTNGKQLTRRRFVNWLNRCDRPMAATAPVPARQQSQPKTVWTLKQQLDAIQEQIKHIETHYAMQTPHGLQWDMMATEEVKQQYAELRQKRKQLKEQITSA
jgi:hypothetical protein